MPPSFLPEPAQGADSQAGSNRAQTPSPQIGAHHDTEAIGLWLSEYSQSPHTLRTYRKEAVRLIAWAADIRGKPVSSLTRADLMAYERFLAAPAADWSDPARPRHGHSRRLIAGPLSPGSIRQSMNILSNLFAYLVAAGYLASNPLALRRRSRRESGDARDAPERYLDQTLWQHVLSFIDTLPQHNQRARQHHERARWLFRLLYGTALRASEAAQATTADLGLRRGKWWLRVTGKGGKVGSVPVGNELLDDLARYRRFYGLPPHPTPGENTPLILPITGRTNRPLTPTALYLIVKEIFRRAAADLAGRDPAASERLRRASTHWLRHTAATHQADAGNDLRHIQKNLRHASIETTALYLHADDDRRHEATVATRPAKG